MRATVFAFVPIIGKTILISLISSIIVVYDALKNRLASSLTELRVRFQNNYLKFTFSHHPRLNFISHTPGEWRVGQFTRLNVVILPHERFVFMVDVVPT